VSAAGTALGYAGSFVFSKLVLRSQQAMVSLPQWDIRHTPWSLAVILLIVLLSVAASVLATRKSLRGLPAENAQQKTSQGKTTIIEHAGFIRRKTGFGMRWTLRDASSHKSRILLGIVSVCGSFMLLIVGSGTPDSIGSMIGRTYSEEFLYEYKLTLGTSNTAEQTAQLCDELDGQLVQTVQGRITSDSTETCFKPVTVFSDGEMLGLETTGGEKLGQNAVYITEGMADTLGIKKGDTIGLFPSMSAQSFEFEIAGIVPSSMPQTLYIGSQCWADAGAQFRPTHMLCKGIDIAALQSDTRISQITASEQLESNLAQFRTKFSGVFTLMKIVAFVLVIIVLYNLSTLSFLERTKQYNTFRVLGFHFGEIRRLASFENIIILLFGTLVGIPFGYKFLDVYCATFSNASMKFYPVLKAVSLVFTCAVVVVCTVITTVLLSRRIRKIDMVQALKER
ncbi:MAG: ABC transporter permease, partial [Ruminococcus sp.]|nr:ABC transporter permease [Ruminococcus sp.]